MSTGSPTSGRSARLVALSLLVCAVLAWIVAGAAFRPVPPSIHFEQWHAVLGAVLVIAVLIVLAVIVRPLLSWLDDRPWLRRAFGALALLVFAATFARVGLALRVEAMWDAPMIEDWAYGMAHGSQGPEEMAWMMALYPNNLMLTSVMTTWFQLTDAIGLSGADTSVVLLNTIVMTTAVAVTFVTARRVAGPVAAWLAGLMCAALLMVSPWSGVAYSDTLGALFPILITYFFVVLLDVESPRWRLVLWLCIGVLGCIGFNFKPTVIFVVFAMVAVLAVSTSLQDYRRSTTWLGAALSGAALSVGFFAAGQGVAALVDHVGITPTPEEARQAMPLTHFLMMGTQETAGNYGAWNGADVALSAGNPDPEDRFDVGLRVYRERVEAMGPLGYAEFLDAKLRWTFSDSSFFAFGEGSVNGFRRPDATSQQIREWVSPWGSNYGRTSLWWQAWWLATLFLVVAPVVMWRRDVFSRPVTMMRLALLMLVVFLALFENRSRYLYLYLPVFFTLAAVTVTALTARAREGTSRTPAAAEEDHAGSDESQAVVSSNA